MFGLLATLDIASQDTHQSQKLPIEHFTSTLYHPELAS